MIALPLVADHTPPATASERVVLPPLHIVDAPVIVPAVVVLLMVITLVAVAVPQPFVTVYNTVSKPAVTPVTRPAATDALPFVALHVPPAIASVSVMFAPGHTDDKPAIVPAVGSGLIVITEVAVAVPQLLVTA